MTKSDEQDNDGATKRTNEQPLTKNWPLAIGGALNVAHMDPYGCTKIGIKLCLGVTKYTQGMGIIYSSFVDILGVLFT
jgi:hypothetical protein